MTLQTKYFGSIDSNFVNAATTDGVLLGDIISKADNLIDVYNNRQSAMLSFMGYKTTSPDADKVSQVRAQWQRFGEHGIASPRQRAQYDIAVSVAIEGYEAAMQWTRFSQVIGSTSEALKGFFAGLIEENAYFRYIQLWQQFFSKTARTVVDELTKLSVQQAPFWNNDGVNVPPPVGLKTFANTHNHYLWTATTGAIVSADLNTAVRHVTEHGYRNMPIILTSETGWDAMQAGATAGDIAVIYERNPLIPDDAKNINQDGAFSTTSADIAGGLFKAVGVFKGKATIALAEDVPADYYGVFSHEGANSQMNPLQFRLSNNPGLQGLRPRNFTVEPLVDQVMEDFFGVGTRQRGNGVAVMWNNHSGAYVDPTWTEDYF